VPLDELDVRALTEALEDDLAAVRAEIEIADDEPPERGELSRGPGDEIEELEVLVLGIASQDAGADALDERETTQRHAAGEGLERGAVADVPTL